MPKLRFPGFEGEWTSKSFENTFAFLSNNTLSRAELSTHGLIKNIHYGDVLIRFGDTTDASSEIPFVSEEAEDKIKKDYIHSGDVIIADTAEDATVGKATEILNVNNNLLVSGLHTIPCRPKLLFAPGFLGYLINSVVFHDQLIPFIQGIKVSSISKSNINRVSIRYPSYSEQEKIAAFLLLLDLKIEKQKKLIDALKSYKRGVSTALFECKIKFRGSFQEWTFTTLGEIFEERNQRADGSEELLAVTINNGVQKRSDLDLKDNSSENKQNYKIVCPGDIAYNTMRMWQGACGVSSYSGIVSPAYTVIYPRYRKKTNSKYWHYFFKETSMLNVFQRFSQGLTSDTWNLKYTQLAPISVYEPSFEEQCRIAKFIETIEKNILLEDIKLTDLFRVKKAILNRIFI